MTHKSRSHEWPLEYRQTNKKQIPKWFSFDIIISVNSSIKQYFKKNNR